MLNEPSTRRLAYEYRSRSLYRVCGGALVAAAALFALALLAGGGTLPMTVQALEAAATPGRVALLWLATPAPALAAGGLLIITRHYRGTSREGWVLLAFAVNVLGGALLTLVHALGAVAAPALLDATRISDAPVVRAAVLAPLSLMATSAAAVGWTLFWLSLLPLSAALTRDRLWPRATAWGAGVVALAEAVGQPLLRTHPGAVLLLRLAGYAYLTLLGLAALRMVRIMRAAAAEAARSED